MKHSPVLHTIDALEHCLDPSMTEWERGRERDEFTRAAQLYVSSHSTLSSRFTHAKEEDDSDQVEVPRDQEVCRHYVSTWCILKLKRYGQIFLNPQWKDQNIHGTIELEVIFMLLASSVL